mmetsp:Transcript_51119/g.103975  ORF Transcript_51119/g.103975 Transcript_51119/m.103975 type:complete len:220 (+) Transcript_51119:404-1063(+)
MSIRSITSTGLCPCPSSCLRNKSTFCFINSSFLSTLRISTSPVIVASRISRSAAISEGRMLKASLPQKPKPIPRLEVCSASQESGLRDDEEELLRPLPLVISLLISPPRLLANLTNLPNPFLLPSPSLLLDMDLSARRRMVVSSVSCTMDTRASLAASACTSMATLKMDCTVLTVEKTRKQMSTTSVGVATRNRMDARFCRTLLINWLYTQRRSMTMLG